MADILSQDEIDALLGALSTGEIEANQLAGDTANHQNAKPYDFYRPSKFSKEQIRTIYMLHETFGRLWSSTLSGVLRNYVNLSVNSVDQVTYQEFIQSIPNPTITATFGMPPLEGRALMEFSPTIGFPIIDRLLGGAGIGGQTSRELTDIEEHVINNLIDEGMVFLKEAWSTMIDLTPELENIESNPLFVQIVPPSDMILLITMEARIGDFSGIMNIVYPYVLLEPILSLLSAQTLYAMGTRAPTEETQERTRQILGGVNLLLRVVLGEAKCTMRELMMLEQGDVMVLDRKADADLDVRIKGLLKFKCTPGLMGKQRAGQITKVLDVEGNSWLSKMAT